MKDEIMAAALRAQLERMKALLKDVEANKIQPAERLLCLRDIETQLRRLREGANR